MKKVLMYTGNPCPYCVYAKALLDSKNIPYVMYNGCGNEHDSNCKDVTSIKNTKDISLERIAAKPNIPEITAKPYDWIFFDRYKKIKLA